MFVQSATDPRFCSEPRGTRGTGRKVTTRHSNNKDKHTHTDTHYYTYVGVGLPDASQGRRMSSLEKAVKDVGISVSTGGCDTENKNTHFHKSPIPTNVLQVLHVNV